MLLCKVYWIVILPSKQFTYFWFFISRSHTCYFCIKCINVLHSPENCFFELADKLLLYQKVQILNQFMNPCGHLFERNYVCNLPENFFLMKKIKVNTIQTYVNIIKQNWPTFLSRPSFYDLLQDLSKRFSHKMICMYIIFIFAIEKRFIRLVDFKNIFSGSDIACQRN